MHCVTRQIGQYKSSKARYILSVGDADVKTVLTGVKPTGMPHIGNYLGAIAPGIKLAQQEGVESLLFIADYHSLTFIQEGAQLEEISYGVAATWMALGLNPERTLIYRQSDIPEVFELSWILSCSTPKGLMNRSHAYKALQASNKEAGRKDPDYGVSMGLYSYPVLMAADILLFRANIVPVGPDQVQHIEVTRDIAQKFNRTYGEVLTLPDFEIGRGELIPGLDGRKMSKSYNNHIPLFESSKKLRKRVMKIKTDSSAPEDPKKPAESLIFDLYKFFSTTAEQADFANQFREGISWGDAKQILYEAMESRLEEPRRIYDELMADRERLDQLLKQGAERAREKAAETMRSVRKAVGAKV
ncbi:tryptophan--tRNA ligase [Bdellovibrionales bacterium]|nr:tryptophan--tRNA ligase [Bdellovibrionales bacterium]